MPTNHHIAEAADLAQIRARITALHNASPDTVAPPTKVGCDICKAGRTASEVVLLHAAFEADEALRQARARVLQLRAERLQFEGAVTGFCHCNRFFRGSDHCQCCGCEEFESTCEHVCDGIGCSSEHDENGRIT